VVRANLRPTREHRPAALVAHAREVAARHDGHAVVDAAPASYKRDHDVFGPLRSDFAIMKRLKDEFDPRRVLAPGRFVGRL
jgi:glycolate oxidase FAD binding subunit